MKQTPESATCVICNKTHKVVRDPEMRKRDELIFALQGADARSQGFREGWVCPTKACLKIAGIDYKWVGEIMKEIPDYYWRARKDMLVTLT